MSQNHLNRSPSTPTNSQTTTFNIIATVKWSIRVKKQFPSGEAITMTNGGWHARGEAIIIRRADVEHVHDYARAHCKLRDFLLVRLPMKIGLRTTEIRTLNIEDIDFQSRSFQVLDSKKKRMFPLPLDVLTLQFIKDLIGARVEGNVFTREDSWKIARQNKPLSRTAVWYVVHGIGVKAGVEGFSPRTCRHYFACKWLEEMRKPSSKKTIVGLQRILRHNNIATTTFYTAQLTFEEDIADEYHDIQEPYIAGGMPRVGFEATSPKGSFYEEFCSHCIHEATCKFIAAMSSCQACSGCRFYKPKKKELMRNV